MFGFIADSLTSFFSILLPVFASYKALRTSDPAVLTPWLMYWTTLSLFLLVESQLNFILAWLPFYSWLRLGVHLYLVLPGKQGSVYLYQQYVHPFLEEHERQIDRLIAAGHARAKAAGVDAIQSAIEYVRVNVLGQEPRQPTTPPASRNVSYSTYLMSRFAMPSARGAPSAAGVGAGAGDLLGLLGRALNQSTSPTSTTRDAQVADLASSHTLVPNDLHGDDRTDFVNTQRERLRTLLQAYDAEAYHSVDAAPPRSSLPRQPSGRKSYLASVDPLGGPMHQSRSESEFEDLAYETMPDPELYRARGERSTPADAGSGPGGRGAGWSNWIWGNYGDRDSVLETKKRD